MNNVINRINMNDPKFKKVKRNVGRKANSLAYMKFEDNFSPFRVSNLPIGSFYSVYRNKDGSFGIIRDFNFFGTEYMISFYKDDSKKLKNKIKKSVYKLLNLSPLFRNMFLLNEQDYFITNYQYN
jgi:hypothetical protein